MANQTVSVNRNFDDAAIAGLVNGDDFTINTDAKLTLNSDNRVSQNAAVIGAITIDANTGGSVLLDSRDVWEIPFSAASGNVPALGTVGVYDATGQNTFSEGEFLGIWVNRWDAPVAAGQPIPAAGILKLRRKSANFDGLGEVITLAGGATVTSTDGGKTGWLEWAFEESTTATVPRLGLFEVQGAWYDLGVTTGVADQRVKYFSLALCPAIEIETAPGSGVYETWLNAGITRWAQVANRVAQDARGRYFGQYARFTGTTTVGSPTITGIADTSLITVGARLIHGNLGTNPYVIAKDATTVTVSVNSVTAGTVSIQAVTEDLVIGQRASNACGYIPPAGCKIRCPNHIATTALSTVGAWARILFPTSTLANRYDFTTTAAGAIVMNISAGHYYLSFAQAYSVSLTDVHTFDQINISECATAPVLTRVAVGLVNTNDQAPFALSSCFAGGALTDCIGLKYECESGDTGWTISDCTGFTFLRCVFATFGDNTAATLNRGAAAYAATFTRVQNSTFTDCIAAGAGVSVATCTDVNIDNLYYSDAVEGRTTNSSSGMFAIVINTSSIRVKVRGFGGNWLGVANTHPYSGIASFSASYDCYIEDVASAASPFDCGSSNAMGLIFALLGNTARITARNCYAVNTRTAAFTDTNSDVEPYIVNVWGDGADAVTVNSLRPKALKGLRSTNPTTGATSVYGTHFYDTFVSATEPRLLFLGNEPGVTSGSRCAITAGTPKFTSGGSVKLVTVGDEITYEMDYFLRGWLTFANAAPTFSGTNSANHVIEYQIERMIDGIPSGWNGTWLTANAANLFAETIPPYVSESNPGGVRLKLRVRCTIASSTNALINIRITGVTNAGTYVRAHPKFYPGVKYTGVQAGSILGVFEPAGGLLNVANETAGIVEAKPAWDADYNATLRLRRAGWLPSEAVVAVVEAGVVLPASQIDWTAVADTDPGALGITLTNHGATPVTWNGKDFSITITTTNDSLTAAQVAAFISWNIAKIDVISGFSGLAWPTMVLPTSANYETARGTLLGSLGATLKGVRVVRSDGTTAVVGFERMQADDGTYWVAPVAAAITAPAAEAGSRAILRNITQLTTPVADYVLPGVGFTFNYLNGSSFNDGDIFELTITKIGKLPLVITGAVSSTGASSPATQQNDTVYTNNAIDGAAAVASGISFNDGSIDIEFTGITSVGWKSIYAAYAYWITTVDGIASFVNMVTAIDEVNYVFNAAIVFNNLSGTPIRVGGDAYATRSDGGSLFGTGNIQIDNFGKAFNAPQDGLASVVEKSIDGVTNITGREALRVMLAFVAGKLNIEDLGGGDFRYSYRNPADTKTRLVGVVRDSDGDRTSVTTLDPT